MSNDCRTAVCRVTHQCPAQRGLEQNGLSELLQRALFSNTEIIAFRDPAAGEYETAAMREEVKRRLHVALPKS